jgi:membrane-associated HD superfamily phosphohydrolase
MDKFRLWVGEHLASYREWIERRSSRRFEFVMLACLIAGVTLIVCTAYLPGEGDFTAGEPAPRSVQATESITVVDSAATEALRADVAALVEPVYVPDPQVAEQAIAEQESFLAAVGQARAALAQTEGTPGQVLIGQDVRESGRARQGLHQVADVGAGLGKGLLRDGVGKSRP